MAGREANQPRLTIGSLFSGIGGLERGLEAAGLGPVKWQAESDAFGREVLARHWPDARRYEDVRDVGADAERVDIVCGGFPCQDVSLAGTGAGLAGKRSGLWTELVRVADVVGCRYLVVENVSALLIRGMGQVLGALAEGGFDASWDCIPAASVGAPHRRDRIFLVAWRVPDAECHALRQLAKRGVGAAFAADAGHTESGHVGGGGIAEVADADCQRRPGEGYDRARGSRSVGGELVGCGSALGDAAGARREGRAGLGERGEERESVLGARGEELAHADGVDADARGPRAGAVLGQRPASSELRGGGEELAHAGRIGFARWREAEAARRAGDVLADADRWGREIERVARRQSGDEGSPWRVVDGRRLPLWPPSSDDAGAWARVPAAAQPAIRRVVDGPARRVDRARGGSSRAKRLRALGNAVVPAVAEVVGRLIYAAEQERLRALVELAAEDLEEAV